MSIQTELCQFTTADGEMLHGLLFRPGEERGDLDAGTRGRGDTGSGERRGAQMVLMLVHGVAFNFYTGPLPSVGRMLAERGQHVLCANNRGHDWISRGGRNLAGFKGAAYETFEESLLDIDAGLAWLAARGYRRFVLFGHSLGAVKVLLYQGTRQRRDVVGVVACSCPRQYYSARATEQPDFEDRLATAEAMVAEGRGEEFLWATTTGAPGLFCARTYVNKYGRHEMNDVRPHASRLGCPLLATVGGAESRFFPEYARELAEAAGTERGRCEIIEGAKHMYRGYEAVLAELVAGWLERIER